MNIVFTESFSVKERFIIRLLFCLRYLHVYLRRTIFYLVQCLIICTFRFIAFIMQLQTALFEGSLNKSIIFSSISKMSNHLDF